MDCGLARPIIERRWRAVLRLPGLKTLKLELVGEEPCEELEGKVDGADTCRIKHEGFEGRRSAGRHTNCGIN
jgi:hypothetical protein